MVGQAGVEQAYNKLLMGDRRRQGRGRQQPGPRDRGRDPSTLPKEGRRLQLTIDADVQRAVEEGFTPPATTAPRSSSIRATARCSRSSASRPTIPTPSRPASIARPGPRSTRTSSSRCRTARCRGATRPGRLSRLPWRPPALEEGVVTPDFRVHCAGGASFYGRYFQCWKKGGHGTVDLRHAIEQSCNVYFYTVGNMLGVDRIHKWASALGLGEKTGIDLPNEVQGLVPSTEWKRQRQREKWYAGETISVAIGQGQVSLTPLSLAVMMMTVANGGTRYTPHVLKAVDEGQGWTPVPPPPPK